MFDRIGAGSTSTYPELRARGKVRRHQDAPLNALDHQGTLTNTLGNVDRLDPGERSRIGAGVETPRGWLGIHPVRGGGR